MKEAEVKDLGKKKKKKQPDKQIAMPREMDYEGVLTEVGRLYIEQLNGIKVSQKYINKNNENQEELVKYKAKTKTLEKKLEASEQKVAKKGEFAKEVKSGKVELSKQLKDMKNEVKKAEDEKNKVLRRWKNLKSKTDKKDSVIDRLNDKIQTGTEKIQDMEQKMRGTTDVKGRLTKENEYLKGNNKELKESVDIFMTENKEQTKKIEELEDKISDLMEEPEVKEYECSICGKSFDSETGLKIHKSRMHPNTERNE